MRRAVLAGVASVAFVLLAGLPARAVPTAEIVGVFRAADCGGQACEPGIDPQVRAGANVRGGLQIHVRAEQDLRTLEWVRLEGRYGSDPRWICLQHWVANDQSTFSGSYDWDTTAWPDPTVNSNCIENAPHYHGVTTKNGTYHLRVVARERRVPTEQSQNHDGFSDPFTLEVNNPPAAPVWVDEPRAGDGPTVTLQWKPNTERELIEYLIVRQNPSGKEKETAISAARPAEQGCTRVGDSAIRCIDREFPARYGGTYRYALIALRAASKGARCELRDRRCIESPLSTPMTVTIDGPRPRGSSGPPAPGPVPSLVPSSVPSAPAAPPGRFDGIPAPLPSASTPAFAPVPVGAGQTEPLPGPSVLGPAATALAALAIAWQLRRMSLERR